MGRGLCCSSDTGSCHTGSEVEFTEKRICDRVQGHGTWCKQARQSVLGLSCPLQVALLFRLRGRGRKWCLLLLWPQGGVSMHAASQGCTLTRVNNLSIISPCAPQLFFRSLFPYHLPLSHLPAFFPGLGKCPQSSSQPRPQTFKTPVLRPCWLQELTKFQPLSFYSQRLW